MTANTFLSVMSAIPCSLQRKRERKTKEEDKRGTKEGAGVSKTQRAGGRKGGKAGVKGRAEFVVGKLLGHLSSAYADVFVCTCVHHVCVF